MTGKRNVRAVIVDDIDEYRSYPGAIEFVVDKNSATAGLAFICPCGCGQEGYLPFRPERSPSWSFNGNQESPSLTPSIKRVGGCGWHGYLTDGEFREC